MDRHLEPLELDEALRGERTFPHLDGCDACRAALERLRAFAARMATPPIEAPARFRRPRRLLWLPAAAAAALLAVAFLLPEPDRADVDGDGSVDIVDAYSLALRLKRGARGTDVNGDGRIDAADVAEIARRAVALSGGGT